MIELRFSQQISSVNSVNRCHDITAITESNRVLFRTSIHNDGKQATRIRTVFKSSKLSTKHKVDLMAVFLIQSESNLFMDSKGPEQYS